MNRTVEEMPQAVSQCMQNVRIQPFRYLLRCGTNCAIFDWECVNSDAGSCIEIIITLTLAIIVRGHFWNVAKRFDHVQFGSPVRTISCAYVLSSDNTIKFHWRGLSTTLPLGSVVRNIEFRQLRTRLPRESVSSSCTIVKMGKVRTLWLSHLMCIDAETSSLHLLWWDVVVRASCPPPRCEAGTE